MNPDDSILFDTATVEIPGGHHCLSLYYTVEHAKTSGTIEAGNDAAEARFCFPSLGKPVRTAIPESSVL